MLLTVTLSACNESESPSISSNDYLIFGRFAGFCIGENCVRIFKLDSNQLAEDTLDKYPGRTDFYAGEFVKISDSKHEIALALLDGFPQEILNETDTVFGCPDCADQGGYYLEVKKDNVHKFWILDTNKSSIPEYLHDYVDKLDAVIGQL